MYRFLEQPELAASYLQWISTHTIMISGCWLWTGPLKRGEPILIDGHQAFLVARIVYQLAYEIVPSYKRVVHICADDRCLYPVHLQPMTTVQYYRWMRDRLAAV